MQQIGARRKSATSHRWHARSIGSHIWKSLRGNPSAALPRGGSFGRLGASSTHAHFYAHLAELNIALGARSAPRPASQRGATPAGARGAPRSRQSGLARASIPDYSRSLRRRRWARRVRSRASTKLWPVASGRIPLRPRFPASPARRHPAEARSRRSQLPPRKPTGPPSLSRSNRARAAITS